MVATAGAAELQTTELVMFCVLPSEYVPVAVNCSFIPRKIAGDCGDTEMETRVIAITVRLADPVTEPEVAVTAVVPKPAPVATP
jgi:hypothetical protein